MATGAVPDLALLPGLNNTHAVFDRLALPASIRVHLPDNPPLTSVDAIATELLASLPRRFWLAGFSFGGYVALAMLAAAPERVLGIAMICSAPFADSAGQAVKRNASIQTAREGRYIEMTDSQSANILHPDSLADAALLEARRRMVRDYGAERYIAHVQATQSRPDRMHLLDGKRPTLVVTSSHDNVVPPSLLRDYAARIPGAVFHQVEGAGHLLPMEQPAALSQLLSDWVQRA
jgi:pimeloyl-ACP methyl ester carboxylesterase